MNRSPKTCKKVCIMCYNSPQNILVLACDHTVCLQCAYVTMTLRTSAKAHNDIEFSCARCNEVTYFDKELIKQIEFSIHSQTKQKNHQKDPLQKTVIAQKYKLNKGESFIEKVRNQYFSQKLFVPPTDKKNDIQNLYQILQTKITHAILSQKQFSINKNNKSHQSTPYSSSHQIFYQPQDLKPQRGSKLKNSQQTKCKSHQYYELIYFCMDCREVVCPQCLLRGQHKDHKNQSISQILEKELPNFINQASQTIFKKISQIQGRQKERFHEINQKFNQIRSIRENAKLYFSRVRKNLQKQQKQVLEKCDQLLNNLKKEQMQKQLRQKELQSSLSKHNEEINSLKLFCQQFSSNEQCNTSRKGIEKFIIHKYLNCLKSVKSFQDQYKKFQFGHQLNHQSKKDQISLTNQSQLLNQKIQEGIKSIRQSLVFDHFSKPVNMVSFYQKNQPNQYECRITTKLEPIQQKCEGSKKLSQPNQYFSYIQTQNSQIRSKQKSQKSRQKSASISPYKGEIQQQNIQQRKSFLPFKKSMLREKTQLGKENLLLQEGVKEIKTELSTQNASAIKSQSRKDQKTRQNSKQKSRNSSVAKNKKKNSISYTNSIVKRFKA